MLRIRIESSLVNCNSQFIELFGDPFCNEHWNCKPLDQIFSMIGRGKQPKYVENSNIRLINQACIYWDGIKYENVKFHDSTSKKAKLTLEPGDVLINSTGTGTLGRAQVFDIGADEIEYITDSHVTVLRGTEKILPQFFQMILSLPETDQSPERERYYGVWNLLSAIPGG